MEFLNSISKLTNQNSMKLIKILATVVILSASLIAPCAHGDVVFKTLLSFTGTDTPYYGLYGGGNRTGGMVQGDDGNFYGTTQGGGTNLAPFGGCGTVFKMTPDGTFTTIYSFGAVLDPNDNVLDGQGPEGNLIKGADGKLYGTTYQGGVSGYSGGGTFFQITTNGAHTIIYSFGINNSDGTNYDGLDPQAGVVQGTDGNFYGTTTYGGAYGQGTVFQLTPGGVLTTLHSFTKLDPNYYTNADGAEPSGELVQGDDGNFYGTATSGGVYDGGTIFQITPGGAFTTLFSFNSFGGTNGYLPFAGLCNGTDGNFFGTTYGGGFFGNGTVFQITTNGVLTTLHSFTAGGNDGGEPVANLIEGSDGNFYGTTIGNTVFQITTNGTFTVLHTFSGLDGKFPRASLVQGTDGNFYGTTASDGATYNPLVEPSGYGTIFKITIPPAFQSVAQTNGLFNFTWSIMPGQTYQIQCNTNLSSTNWVNLGSSVTASNVTACASDSMTNSQCFYRIMLAQ
jgi:uncharacterized repeat protein (TIGR03803 family)